MKCHRKQCLQLRTLPRTSAQGLASTWLMLFVDDISAMTPDSMESIVFSTLLQKFIMHRALKSTAKEDALMLPSPSKD